jgi:hypothetical protein
MFNLYFILLIFCNNLSAFSGEMLPDFAEKNPGFAYVYQQPKFMKEDLVGDILLAKSVQHVPIGLINILIGRRSEYYTKPYLTAYKLSEKYPSLSRRNGEDASYISVVPKPRNYYLLDENVMKEAFAEVLHSRPTTKGAIPTWSHTFKEHYQSKILYGLNASKLLLCLMRGVCARFMLTGQEKNLEKWSMDQKDQSISPELFFKSALKLHQGNITLALLTCHNILSWHSKANKRYLTQLQSKLRPFKTSKYELSKDKFGEWYHLFGLMTYTFVKGSAKAETIALSESLGGRLFSNFQPEIVEEEVNNLAPDLGAHLAQLCID